MTLLFANCTLLWKTLKLATLPFFNIKCIIIERERAPLWFVWSSVTVVGSCPSIVSTVPPPPPSTPLLHQIHLQIQVLLHLHRASPQLNLKQDTSTSTSYECKSLTPSNKFPCYSHTLESCLLTSRHPSSALNSLKRSEHQSQSLFCVTLRHICKG